MLCWIRGYKIPFTRRPIQAYVPSEVNWSKTEVDQIKNQIEKLLSKKIISKSENKKGQFLPNRFLVPKPDVSVRLILNLKKLNEFIQTEYFELEDI